MDTNLKRKNRAGRHNTVQIIVDLTLWIAVSLPVVYLFLYGKPHQTGFFCDDPSLSLPYEKSSISTPLLLVIGFSASIFLIVLTEVLNHIGSKCQQSCIGKKSIMFGVKSYIVFLLGVLLEEMMVEVIKNMFGALRPNFFAVCNPRFNKTLCPGFISDYSCSRDEEDPILRSSRQSFPSGHATFSMYIAIYFCIFVEKRLQIRFSRLLKIFLQSGLVLAALLCGLGRIKDHRHHPSDIIAGFLLGTVVAMFIHITLGRQIRGMESRKSTTSSRTDMANICSRIEEYKGLIKYEPSMFLQTDDSLDCHHGSPDTIPTSIDSNNQTSTNEALKLQHEDV